MPFAIYSTISSNTRVKTLHRAEGLQVEIILLVSFSNVIKKNGIHFSFVGSLMPPKLSTFNLSPLAMQNINTEHISVNMFY